MELYFIPFQLSRVSLDLTVIILRSILQSRQLSHFATAPSSDLLTSAIQAASNILESASGKGATDPGWNYDRNNEISIHTIITQTIRIIDGLLKVSIITTFTLLILVILYVCLFAYFVLYGHTWLLLMLGHWCFLVYHSLFG